MAARAATSIASSAAGARPAQFFAATALTRSCHSRIRCRAVEIRALWNTETMDVSRFPAHPTALFDVEPREVKLRVLDQEATESGHALRLN